MKHQILPILVALGLAAGAAGAKVPAVSSGTPVNKVDAAGAVGSMADPESMAVLGAGLIYLTMLWRRRNKF